MPAVAATIQDEESAKLAKLRRYLPWLVAVALFMENLDATIVNTAVPKMAESLSVEPLSLKTVLTSYTLSLAVFIPISGWAADRFGTKKVFAGAINLFLLGSLLCGLAVNVPMLVAARIIQGIGGAMMTPVGRLSLVRTFPRSEMIAVMNFVVIPALIGPLLGPVVGGFIVEFHNWRTIFYLNLPIGLAGLWFSRLYMPDYRDENVAPLDFRGFVLFGVGVGLLSHVLEVFSEHSWKPLPVIALTVGAIVFLYLYWRHAKKVTAPMLDLVLLRIRTFRASVLGGFVTRLGIGGMPFLLPLLYQIGLGYPAWQAGLLTMPQAIAAAGMKVLSKNILKKHGHRRVLIGNTVLLGCTMLIFTQVRPGTPVWLILPLSLAMGFFASLQFTSMNSLVYADISDAEASRASSIASTAQQLSLSFGVASASLVAGYFLEGVPQSDHLKFLSALHHAFFTIGILTMLSALTFRGLKPDDGRNVSHYAGKGGVKEAA